MVDRIRAFLVSTWLTRTILRMLLPTGRSVRIGGHTTVRIPLSLVSYIVDRIDARGIHEGFTLRLDGGKIWDLSKQAHPELSVRQLIGLHDAGDIGLESAAMTMNGDVLIATYDAELIERAQRRGQAVGFGYANAVLAMARDAAARSGRRLSGVM